MSVSTSRSHSLLPPLPSCHPPPPCLRADVVFEGRARRAPSALRSHAAVIRSMSASSASCSLKPERR
eukprot:6189664-Pleurochrysis_carterae.AAC.3